ncbi:hypothetical protein DFJ73DRAFT_465618 [Zopfochytrium polystomum]|nr:hypothetical protein DFJ73DRAFT_465618 [Zopfochytrium polystomum]
MGRRKTSSQLSPSLKSPPSEATAGSSRAGATTAPSATITAAPIVLLPRVTVATTAPATVLASVAVPGGRGAGDPPPQRCVGFPPIIGSRTSTAPRRAPAVADRPRPGHAVDGGRVGGGVCEHAAAVGARRPAAAVRVGGGHGGRVRAHWRRHGGCRGRFCRGRNGREGVGCVLRVSSDLPHVCLLGLTFHSP